MRGDIRNELILARCSFARDGRRLMDARMRVERVLDLAHLNSKPTHLCLIIEPAKQLNIAVGSPTGAVTRSIHAAHS